MLHVEKRLLLLKSEAFRIVKLVQALKHHINSDEIYSERKFPCLIMRRFYWHCH